MVGKRILLLFLVFALFACVCLLTIPIVSASVRAQIRAGQMQSFDPSALSQPDYDSGLITLPQATAVSLGLAIDHVNPTNTYLNHNLGTYNLLVQVLADDGQGGYVPIPSAVYPGTVVGGGIYGQTQWFLTSQNQILLQNYDYGRAVPVHVMIWKIAPDYDSGLITLTKAAAWDNPGTITYPDAVTPTNTSLNHNLGTYNILVQVLADDGYGRYVPIPSAVYPTTTVGGGYWGQTQWFLTSQNQIMLENWDYNRAVPVHVMIWKIAPDYDSGLITLPQATPHGNPLDLIYPTSVTPTETTLSHNLGTYNILVYVLAVDGQGRYVQIPSAVYPSTLVGGTVAGVGSIGQTQWFLTSQNQIMLENWDYNRAVPVHVMIWKPQASVQVTFSQTGLTPDFAGTVLTVDASSYRVADLPISFSWNLGSNHSFAYQSPLLVTSNAKQYLWTSTSGLVTLQSGSINVSSSGNLTGNYKTQYYLTVSSMYDSPFPSSGWFDSGSSITDSVTSPVSGGSGTRYVCTGWSGNGSVPASGSASSVTFTIAAASAITWNWKTQYTVSFSQSGLDSSASGTIAIVNGVPVNFGQLPFDVWVDNGASIMYSYDNVSSSNTAERFNLLGVSGLPSPATVIRNMTITGNYWIQYEITLGACALGNTASFGNTVLGTDWRNIYIGAMQDGGYFTSSSNGLAQNIAVGYYSSTLAHYKLQCALYYGNGTFIANTTEQTIYFSGSSWFTCTFQNPLDIYAGQQYLIMSWVDATGENGANLYSLATGTQSNNETFDYIPYVAYEWANPLDDNSNRFMSNGILSIYCSYSVVIGFPAYSAPMLTVDSNTYSVGTLPVSFWWDSGSNHAFSFASPLTVNASTQYTWISTSGFSTLQNGTITITAPGGMVGNYAAVNSYQITFNQTDLTPDFTGTVLTVDSSNYGVKDLPVSFWWSSGSSHTFSYPSRLIVAANMKQYVWTSTNGLSSVQTGTIIVSSSGSITGNYKTQYYLTVTSPYSSPSPSNGWFDSGSSITESVMSPVSGGSGIQYVCTSWTGTGSVPASGSATSVTFTISAPSSITWNWKTQYQITFGQTGVGLDYSGTVITVDGANYGVSGLSVSFWFDSVSSHSFSFASPLVVGSKQYAWNSTSGLSTLQGGALTMTAPGSIVGNYIIPNQITFDQVGVSSDFTGTVMIIDALSYSKEQLPISFSWSSGSTHSFAFQSPLIVEASNKQYVWTSTTGLSSSQNGSITVTTYGSIIGNYKTQYYLIVTSPYDSPIPLGGWFDFGASITDSVTSPVSGGSGTQYMCTGWSGTGSVPASGSTSSVTFMISAPSTITWIWKTQHQVTFDQTGVGTDFAGTVVTLDGLNYGVSGLPTSFWLDNGSNHSFSFAWPLVVGSKQYAWNSTSGLSTFQSGTLTITASGNVIGNYFQQNGTNAHDFAVTNIASSKTVIGQGYCGNLILTLQNLGSFNEYFNVTIYANSTIINTLNFNLTSGKATTQDLLWNTTGFTYGNFTISAYTWPVPGETNTANNNFTGNVVTVTIPGDINGDFKVGLTDLVLLAQAYGSKLSDPNWNPTADMDGNGVVGLSDLVILAQQYGQNYP